MYINNYILAWGYYIKVVGMSLSFDVTEDEFQTSGVNAMGST